MNGRALCSSSLAATAAFSWLKSVKTSFLSAAMISIAACRTSLSALGLSRGVAMRAGIAAEPQCAAISRYASFSSTSPSRGCLVTPAFRLSGTMQGVEPPM